MPTDTLTPAPYACSLYPCAAHLRIYKIYAESFRDEAHLAAIVDEGRRIVGEALGGGAAR